MNQEWFANMKTEVEKLARIPGRHSCSRIITRSAGSVSAHFEQCRWRASSLHIDDRRTTKRPFLDLARQRRAAGADLQQGLDHGLHRAFEGTAIAIRPERRGAAV